MLKYIYNNGLQILQKKYLFNNDVINSTIIQFQEHK